MWSPSQTKSFFYRKTKVFSTDSYAFPEIFRFHHTFDALAGSFSYHTEFRANYQPKLAFTSTSAMTRDQMRRDSIKISCMKSCFFPALSVQSSPQRYHRRVPGPQGLSAGRRAGCCKTACFRSARSGGIALLLSPSLRRNGLPVHLVPLRLVFGNQLPVIRRYGIM